MLRAPGAASALIAKVAVIRVALTTVTELADTPEPPIAIVAPAMKPEPFSVTATLAPGGPLLGAIELRTGVAAVTVTVAVPIAEGEMLLAA